MLHPEKRLYTVQQSMMTEAGIDAGFTRDLYVALGEPLDNGAWAVRVHIKPYVRWIWLGGLLTALGGFLAASTDAIASRSRPGCVMSWACLERLHEALDHGVATGGVPAGGGLSTRGCSSSPTNCLRR